MNIVLVGLMGAGKSSVGRILAERLGRPFIDTDAWIEKQAGRPIPVIFEWDGEGAFRAMEEYAVEVIAGKDGQVVATGGGAVLAAKNREALRRTGTLFWLDASPEELLRRAAAEGVAKRPLLAGEDPLGRLAALAESRREAYTQAAHHRIDTDGKRAGEVADAILTVLHADGYPNTSEGDNGNVAGES